MADSCPADLAPAPRSLSDKIGGKTFKVVPVNFEQAHPLVEEGKIYDCLCNDLRQISLLQAAGIFWKWILVVFIGFSLMVGATAAILRLNRRFAHSNERLRTEINWRQKITKALEESEQFNRAIVSGVGDGLFVCDKFMHFRIWNKRMEDMTGIREADALAGGTRRQAYVPLLAAIVSTLFCKKHWRRKTILSEEIRIRCAPGWTS